MKTITTSLVVKVTLCTLLLIISSLSTSICSYASNEKPVVVVSLGDSYSSGEGIEPFYGQDKEWEDKLEDENWLARY